MSLLRQLVKRTLTTLLPCDALVTRGVGEGLALTFDDGPHPEFTPRLLDALNAADISATFFVVGEQAARHSNILRRIADDGHELGNHTWSHSKPRETSAWQLIDEVRCTQDLIESATGRECRLFRPPKGELTLRKLLALRRERQTVVLWNHDTKDYRMSEVSDEIVAWCCGYQPAFGDIVLMHDNHPHAIAAVEFLNNERPDVLSRCRTVSQLLNLSSGDRTASSEIRRSLCTGS
jgi:peptidoglycan/xylan/chitin deacetylase (PgdA/CDA1 family)